MLLWDRGWRSHSQLSDLPDFIAWPQLWQGTGLHIWHLSSGSSFRGIMESLRYSFVANDDDSFAVDWLGSKDRFHMQFSNSTGLSFSAPGFPPSFWTIGLPSVLLKLSACIALKHKVIWAGGALVSVRGGRACYWATICNYLSDIVYLGQCDTRARPRLPGPHEGFEDLGGYCHLLIAGMKTNVSSRPETSRRAAVSFPSSVWEQPPSSQSCSRCPEETNRICFMELMANAMCCLAAKNICGV